MNRFTVSLMAAALFASMSACAVDTESEGNDLEGVVTEEIRSIDPDTSEASGEEPMNPDPMTEMARQQQPERSTRWTICPAFFPFCLECWGIPSEPQTHTCTVIAPRANAQ